MVWPKAICASEAAGELESIELQIIESGELEKYYEVRSTNESEDDHKSQCLASSECSTMHRNKILFTSSIRWLLPFRALNFGV